MNDTITILFADAPGTMVGKRRLWGRLEAAIIAYGGRTERRDDGALLAYFQSASRQDDAERAVRAALAIQNEIQELRNEARLHENPVTVADVSIGINIGPVDAIGDPNASPFQSEISAIALAEFLQKQAPDGTIVISHPIYRRVRGVFNLKPLETDDGTSPQYYCVQSAKPRPFRQPTRGVAGVETRMIGRRDEMQKLVTAMETVVNQRRMQALTVVGDVGIGKSRLIYEFQTHIDLHTQEMWLFRARAMPQTEALPYALIRQMFSYRCEIYYSDTAATARDKLVQHVQQFIPGTAGEAHAHFIGQLLGFNFAYSAHLRNVNGRQILSRAMHYIAAYFSAVTDDDPIVMFLEDLQWADRASLDLLEHIIQTCANMPILLITSARPEFLERHSHWQKSSITLQPLSSEDSARLVLQMVRKLPDVPGDLTDRIVHGAGGVPLTMEQRMLKLVDAGIIEHNESGWYLDTGPTSFIRFPPTLEGLIQSRIEALSAAERAVLLQAAVIGFTFWRSALQEENIDTILDRLHQKDFITPLDYSSFAVTQEYRFNHPYLCELAYRMLDNPEWQHGQYASWRVANSAQRVREYAGLLAYHYEHAQKAVQAIEYLLRAGKEAYRIGAFQEARQFFERALNIISISGSLSRKATLMVWLGDVLWQLGDYQAAHDMLANSLVLSRKIGDQKVIADTLLLLGRVAQSQHHQQFAWEHLQESLQIARSIGDRESIANAEMYLGELAMAQDKLDEAKMHFEACLSIHKSLSHRFEIAQVFASLAEIAYRRGNFTSARALLRTTLTTARDIDATVIILQVMVLTAGILVAEGEPDRARMLLQAALSHPAMTDALRNQAAAITDIEMLPEANLDDFDLLLDTL